MPVRNRGKKSVLGRRKCHEGKRSARGGGDKVLRRRKLYVGRNCQVGSVREGSKYNGEESAREE